MWIISTVDIEILPLGSELQPVTQQALALAEILLG